MTQQSLSSSAGNILGESPRGLTESTKLEALALKARIQSGEAVPLEELRAFILSADKDLTATRKTRVNPVKSDDVNFF